MAQPRVPMTGKVTPDTEAKVIELVEVLGITRSQFISWALEESVARTYARIGELRAERQGMPPGVPA